jgi:hypothetical protein
MSNISLLTTKIQESLSNLCNATRERTIQDLLVAVLDEAQPRQTFTSDIYPMVEIDVIWRDLWIEVKFNAKYYDGIAQLCAQHTLYQQRKNVLIHIHRYLNKKFINALRKLSSEIGFYCILIDTQKKQIIQLSPHASI